MRKRSGATEAVAVAETSTGIVPRENSSLVTVDTLDEAVSEFREQSQRAVTGAYGAAVVVRRISETGLWKLRTRHDEKGKETAQWNNFHAFAVGELQITPRYADQLVDIANNFSEEEIRTYGPTKLKLLLNAAPADRPSIQRQIRQGATKIEVATAVAESRERTGHRKSNAGRKPESARGSPNTLTIATLLGSSTIKLYKKPASLKGVDIDKLPRATKIADEPIGVLEFENDVCAYFYVLESPTGELVMRALFKRAES
jgi:hypothetical protein